MKRKITPQMLIEILGKNGQEINLENAHKVLDLIYDLCELSIKMEIKNTVNNNKSSIIEPEEGNGARTLKKQS